MRYAFIAKHRDRFGLIDAEPTDHRCGGTGPANGGMAAQTLAAGLIHSDQGLQSSNMDSAAFMRVHNLEHSMSRRGKCHDTAATETFFSSLKHERIQRRT